jgi:hypothetical protein
MELFIALELSRRIPTTSVSSGTKRTSILPVACDLSGQAKVTERNNMAPNGNLAACHT